MFKKNKYVPCNIYIKGKDKIKQYAIGKKPTTCAKCQVILSQRKYVQKTIEVYLYLEIRMFTCIICKRRLQKK